MASSTSLSSITVTVSHAIAYLTRPLVAFMPASTVTKLQLALEANLTAHYAHSWVPSEPLRGSGRRCLSISPTSLPPRPIYASCVAAKVQWSEWMTALGNVEFDLFVDPGLVSVRFIRRGATSKLITIWSEEGAEEPRSQSEGSRASASSAQHRVQLSAKTEPVLPTLAQQLMIEDEEDEEELFTALANELREPTWTTPVLSQFPSAIPQKCSTLSRRERARKARVFIDTTKKEVTNYDGGKTTVLTGGVMLGGRPVPPKPASAAASSCDWRSTRA
ncbi:hypothetical protein EDB83DRAFT_2218406 [Lactarius deliciosus]|nr:hypothetical protein EDB83DRAFT_2218406 [Lactarius deliciosus]